MKDFIGKLFITGQIELLTGMSIGCGGQSGIGLIDSPVIKNPLTNKPYIPGSSLKGRLRHALQVIDSGIEKNLFGQGAGDSKDFSGSKVYVRDCDLKSTLQNNSELFEIKYENTIDHVTGTTRQGGLRQMERVIPGAIFIMELVYNYYSDSKDEDDLKDLEYLHLALEFVQDEYLGGSGSRGYGKVEFNIKKLTYKSKAYYLGEEDLKSSKEGEVNSSNWVEKAKELIYGKVPAKV